MTAALSAQDNAANPPQRPKSSSISTKAPTKTQSMLLVGNKGEDSVSFIDLDTGREVRRVGTNGPAPHEIAISPDGKQAAIVHYGANGIELFDIASRQSVMVIELPENARPHGLVWLRDGRLIASAEGIDAIAIANVCSPNEDCVQSGYYVNMISTGQKGSHMVAVSPDAARAYTANLTDGSVTMIDLAAGRAIRSVAAGAGAEGIAITADGTEIWASARETNKAYVYDAETLDKKAEVDVGKFPLRIIASPDGKYMVTSNLVDGNLSVIDIAERKVVRTIKVTGDAGARQVTILFNADGSRIYAALTGMNKIAEIDFASGELLGMLSGGQDGDGLAIVTAAP
ncbi:YncE family protein [Sphingorhabdus arenilitoris]|uniref:YncE family protein n=1 Tax=Sphingorhabdus arenilitoris TaxID=1490041 RepID=A0ABV8RKC3_9SPHN